MIYKECSKCRREKLADEFHQGGGIGGRAAWCKDCVAAYKASEWVPGRPHRRKKRRVSRHVLYVIQNPAWPGWVRLGATSGHRAKAPEQARLEVFNRFSPHQDYELAFSIPAGSKAPLVELKAFMLLEEDGVEVSGGWAECSVKEARKAIKRAMEALA